MNQAYWLAFALALTPILMQLVATILCWPIVSITLHRQRGLPETRSLWPYLCLLLLAFGLMFYQTGYVATLYIPDAETGFLAQSVDVLGVSIPLELGENVNAFVDAAVFLLLILYLFGFLVFLLIYLSRQLRAKGTVASWAFGLFILFFLVIALWNAWRTLPYQIEDLQALF